VAVQLLVSELPHRFARNRPHRVPEAGIEAKPMAYLRKFLRLPANESSVGFSVEFVCRHLRANVYSPRLAGRNYRQSAGSDPLAGRNENRRLERGIALTRLAAKSCSGYVGFAAFCGIFEDFRATV
jgi:hypothetical protein